MKSAVLRRRPQGVCTSAVSPLPSTSMLSPPSFNSAVSSCSLQSPALKETRRHLRQRLIQSPAREKWYNMDNPVTAKNWPPLHLVGEQLTQERCRELMHHLQLLEMDRMRKARPFQMPKINPGDLVEVRYELTRTKQTFAVFQGYCIQIRKKRICSSFVLKNAYDGVGIEQLFPKYSPRILDVKVVRALQNPQRPHMKPITRDYRYRWHYNVRHKHSRTTHVHKPGVRTMEFKVRDRLRQLKWNYMRSRVAAGLPPYIQKGPYPVYQSRMKLVRAEGARRKKIYAFDWARRRAVRWRRIHLKRRFGIFSMQREPKMPAVSALPNYHPLAPGNLPK
uniref:50S ribosomal protein L19, chloroplastic n=1 Tax=Chromera velia CCMP2878 TaxID=1169474 RepID=A0A0G4F988_9ALVE|mmetsp:Transcript_42594/g.83988  ORF Transcript_42594/g.83988 Transcript_42594/m.83988 type:complete len:335 (-) Transcript_42594:67-1071(-)|eukprot:Cvel_15858.t1-p1 / transcript=Cvel_15858.t1 / gene=Cvel_15858 / organism=Chromera_velia_CCMP2878 / gene_product=50S ribosomal protein L19, putative / transcript_product=50S ribosomal protein L19, putative / location=Cvel_scaffold1195:39595-43638(-) / protein_length=334 / sequence_SO=supercontig / SO=protein_coding / is_pseudo=false